MRVLYATVLGAAGLVLMLGGCAIPNSAESLAATDVSSPLARTVLPGTSETAVQLVLSQSAAFSILGHSCGGIQENVYATGFDPVSGLPVGDVYIQTRCGGSGRGGGYHTTTYSAWVGATWDFAGNVVSYAKLAAAPTVNGSFTSTDTYASSLQNIDSAAYLVVPAPAAPTGVTVVQSGDQFRVSWKPNGADPAAIMSSTLTAAPSDPALAVLTATVAASATSGLISQLLPLTEYSVTVVSTTIGGSSPESVPVEVNTAAATVPPSAPTGVKASWAVLDPVGTHDNIVVKWNAAVPGDSPVDKYKVAFEGSEGAGTFTKNVGGGTLTEVFGVDSRPDWSMRVRAHNAAGWGPWSKTVRLGGK